MYGVAVYGKGGIGKSTVSANLSYELSRRGHTVTQIGCDPKHDSTRLLLGGRTQGTVLDYVRSVPEAERSLSDMTASGSGGVICVEAGGPEPGRGCAGRGILTALDTLRRLGPPGTDVTVYDVLGDVVCGGFAVPLREGLADAVLVVTSGEFMSLYAANNILRAVRRFSAAAPRLLGLVLDSRGVEGESERVRAFADAVGARVVAEIPRDGAFAEAEAMGATVAELLPDTGAAASLRAVADAVEGAMGGAALSSPTPLDDDQLSDLAAGRPIRPGAPDVGEGGCGACRTARGYQKYSCASCGAVMALARLSDTAVVIHGPRSCAYLMDSAYLSTVMDIYSAAGGRPMPDNVYSTGMDDTAAIFGGDRALERTIAEAYGDGFREIAVVTTCVSGMIGDDCQAVARRFGSSHPDAKVAVLRTDGVMTGDYTDGMAEAMSYLVASIDRGAPQVPGTVNVVGYTFFDIQGARAEAELGRMLSVFGLRVNCRFLDETDMASVRGFGRGSVDMLANEAQAAPLARRLREATGTEAPAVRVPTGYREYVRWLDEMGRITGKTAEAEAEGARAGEEYSRFLEANRPRFEGRRVSVSTCIARDADWLVDSLEDLGAKVVRFGVIKGPDAVPTVSTAHRDEVEPWYGPDRMAEDWDALRPDLLIYDVDIPAGYPGANIRMDRVGPGLRPALEFLGSLPGIMRLSPEPGWRRGRLR